MRTWPALEVGPPGDRDLFEAALVDYGVTALDSPATSGAVRVFFPTDDARRRAQAGLRTQFPGLTLRAVDVPDEDWVSRSQSSLRAVRVGEIVVAPPWDVPTSSQPAPGTSGGSAPALRAPHVIVIQPSMGFGTGHHATTRLCLQAMQHLDLKGRTVLDAGTGSGLLAIAACRLGAAEVLAIDNDADAVEAARDNLALNGDPARVTVRTADLRSMRSGTFDAITANLTGAFLQDAAESMTDLTRPGGDMILSGFMNDEADDVLAAYRGCTLSARTEEDEWVCVTLRRR
jgi:ribosomal protein L11 methyltransferase